MSEADPLSSWRFFKFGLLVTGKGESEFLPELLRVLTDSGRCSFEVVRRIGQRSPITSQKRQLKMVGSGKDITTRDETDIGIPARNWLDGPNKLLLLIDDLEHDRRGAIREVFGRYRAALDTMLQTKEQRARASVHLLVNMLEAYYFADVAAVNAVLGMSLSDHVGDVEDIPHPKNKLKKLHPDFDEIRDGEAIVRQLNVEHVLDNSETCGSLRVLFAWCVQSMGIAFGARFRLDSGAYDLVTGAQLGRVAP
jgi:hypothetical protein